MKNIEFKHVIYKDFKDRLKKKLNFNFKVIMRNNNLKQLFIKTVLAMGEETSDGFMIPFDIINKDYDLEDEILEELELLNIKKNKVIEYSDIKFDSWLCERIITPVGSEIDVKNHKDFYLYYRSHALMFNRIFKINENESYSLSELNNTTTLEQIFEVKVNKDEDANLFVPAYGLFLENLLEEKSQNKAFLGWIEEKEDEEEALFTLTGSEDISIHYPLIFLEKLNHHYDTDVKKTVYSTEKIWQMVVDDKIKFLFEQHRKNFNGNNYIEINQFNNVRIALGKYEETPDENSLRTQQSLTRIVTIPMNIKSNIAKYELENASKSYYMHTTNILGETQDSLSKGKGNLKTLMPFLELKENLKLKRKGSIKSYFKFISHRWNIDEIPKMDYSEIAYSKNVNNLAFMIHMHPYDASLEDIGVCSVYDGTYLYNRYNYIYSKKSLGDIFSDTNSFNPVDLKRCKTVLGLKYTSNSDSSKVKGTNTANACALFDQHPKLKELRSQYFKLNSGHIDSPMNFELSSGTILTHLPVNSTSIGDLLKYLTRLRSLNETKALRTEAIDPMYFTIVDCETGKERQVEKSRNMKYLVNKASDINQPDHARIYGVAAFLPRYLTLPEDYLIRDENDKVKLNHDYIDSLSNKEMHEFNILLGETDGQSKITEVFANQHCVLEKNIKIPLKELLQTNFTKSLIKLIEDDGAQEFKKNEVTEMLLLDETFMEVRTEDLPRIAYSRSYMCNNIFDDEKCVGHYLFLNDKLEELTDIQSLDDIHSGVCTHCGEKFNKEEIEAEEGNFDLFEYVEEKENFELKKYTPEKYVFEKVIRNEKEIVIKVSLYTKIRQARILSLMMKSLSNIMHKDFIGRFEVPMLIDNRKCIVKGSLDLNLVNLANKSKDNGEVLLLNALVNVFSEKPLIFEEKYAEENSVEKTSLEKIQEDSRQDIPEEYSRRDILQKAQDSYNKELNSKIQPGFVYYSIITPQGKKIEVKQKANIGLMPVIVTENTEDYIKEGVDENFGIFSPMHPVFLTNLKEEALTAELYKSKVVNRMNHLDYFKDFLDIIYQNPADKVSLKLWKINYQNKQMIEKFKLDFSGMIDSADDFDNIQIKNEMLSREYQNLVENLPLFQDSKYVNGFTYTLKYTDKKELFKRTFVFPSKSFLLNEANVRIRPNGKVNISKSTKSWIMLFLSLAKISKKVKQKFNAKFEVSQSQQTYGKQKLSKEIDNLFSEKYFNQKLIRIIKRFEDCLSQLREEFEKKKGLVHKIGALTYNFTGAKQEGSVYLPIGYAVITNDRFKKLTKTVLKQLSKELFGENHDRSDDSDIYRKILFKIMKRDTEYFKFNPIIVDSKFQYEDFTTEIFNEVLLTFNMYGIADRSPAIMTTQELVGSVKVINVDQANQMFRQMYFQIIDGERIQLSFTDIYPDFKGTMINSLDMVMGFQADQDGDHLRIMIAHTSCLMTEVKKMFLKHEFLSGIRSNDPKYAVTKSVMYKWSMNYLIEEYETNLFDRKFNSSDRQYNPLIDTQKNQLDIIDNVLTHENLNLGSNESTLVKVLIGKLSVSNWLGCLILDYGWNTGVMAEYGISHDDFVRMRHILEVLLQLGYIRGLKEAGELQGTDFHNLVMNANIVVHDASEKSHGKIQSTRKILMDFVVNFAQENMGSDWRDLPKSLEKMYLLFDKWWINEGPYDPLENPDKTFLKNRYRKDPECESDISKLISGLQGILFASSSAVKRSDEYYSVFNLLDEENAIDDIKQKLIKGSSFYEPLKDFFNIIENSKDHRRSNIIKLEYKKDKS